MRNLLLALALVATFPAVATDGKPINETRPLAPDGRLSVSNVAGLIQVKAWGKNEVQITGTLGAGSERLEISGTRDDLRVEVILPRRSRNAEGSELILQVPENAQLELKGVSADIRVTGTRGPARVSSVSGDVTVEAAMKELRATSVSGDLSIKTPSANTRLEAVSGDIHAEQLTGVLRLETVSGDATVSGARFSEIDLETVSGDLELRIEGLADGGEIEVESVSGNLDLFVPKALDATVVLESFSGRLRSDVGEPVRRTGDTWEATLGNGKSRIRMESHSGNIALKTR